MKINMNSKFFLFLKKGIVAILLAIIASALWELLIKSLLTKTISILIKFFSSIFLSFKDELYFNIGIGSINITNNFILTSVLLIFYFVCIVVGLIFFTRYENLSSIERKYKNMISDIEHDIERIDNPKDELSLKERKNALINEKDYFLPIINKETAIINKTKRWFHVFFVIILTTFILLFSYRVVTEVKVNNCKLIENKIDLISVVANKNDLIKIKTAFINIKTYNDYVDLNNTIDSIAILNNLKQVQEIGN